MIDARERYPSMRHSLGNKRRYMGEADLTDVVCEYGKFAKTEMSKIFTDVKVEPEILPVILEKKHPTGARKVGPISC